jgi:hypothetical protein
VEFQRGAGGKVNCDMHLLETVIKNLLCNAARYAMRDLRIDILHALKGLVCKTARSRREDIVSCIDAMKSFRRFAILA